MPRFPIRPGALLARLGDRESLSVSELAQPFSISLPAIIKHLDVLSDAGLIAREKTGRTVACRLTAGPMEQAMDWLNRYQRFWSDNLDRLAAFFGGRPMATQSSLAKSSTAKSSNPRDAELAARPSLTLKRRLNAAPEKVYAAWADAERLVQWFGPASVEAGSVKADIDLRVGGHYRISFNANGQYNQVGGVYREVAPNERLVFSWAWHSTPERESLVTISMKPDGAGTLLTFHHEQFADATARDNHERGWTEFLGKLENYLA
ncbi:SRPBCC domain-containing protein [Bradyrhizobium sp. TZ2]